MADPTFFSDGNTPNRQDSMWTITQKILGAVRDGGGGGGGDVTGVNYRIESGVLSLKNLNTGLFNRVDTVNPDPAAAINISDGAA